MQEITEEMGLHKQWYERAKSQTLSTLPTFIESIVNYKHDYGTICHAITAAGIAAMNAVNKSEQGGITCFQAGAIMWNFIIHWMNYKSPLRLIDYGNMLYPQYQHKFEKIITSDTWKYLQDEAIKNLEGKNEHTNENVMAHWQSIVDGVVPFGYSISDEK